MNHNDHAIEKEIVAKGKKAPRVTPADIEANIDSEHYFTAKDGVIGDLFIGGVIDDPDGHGLPQSLDLLTFCVLTLRNGFTVTGESACASPENFDAEIGRKVARENAVQKIWPLMGYALKCELHRRAVFDASPKVGHQVETKTYADGMSATGTPPLPNISPTEQGRLQQHVDMVRESGWVPGGGAGEQRADHAVAGDLPPHQKRVVDEKRELDERKQKLAAFFETPTFAQLDDSEQGRLHAQHDAMVDYSRILGDRIEAFTSLSAA